MLDGLSFRDGFRNEERTRIFHTLRFTCIYVESNNTQLKVRYIFAVNFINELKLQVIVRHKVKLDNKQDSILTS